MKTVVANFKANKNIDEVINWFEKFHLFQSKLSRNDSINVIICPAFTAIDAALRFIRTKKWNFSLCLGSQDVSQYESGSYTGEVTAGMLVKLAEFAIIGHSERSRYCSESRSTVNNKVGQLKSKGIEPIVCIVDESDINSLKSINYNGFLAYEPLSAIGSGKPDSPTNIVQLVKTVNLKLPKAQVLYGGSINTDNCQEYFSIPSLSGLLVGSASLDPQVFYKIIKNVE